MICALMIIISNYKGIKCLHNLLQLEQCNVMFNVKMAHWHEIRNTIVIACTGKKMIGALMFMINNHYGTKCRCNLLHLEPCNLMFKVISDIMEHWYDCEIQLLLQFNFCNGKNYYSIDVYH